MKNRKRFTLVPLALAAAIMLTACTGGTSQKQTEPAPVSEEAQRDTASEPESKQIPTETERTETGSQMASETPAASETETAAGNEQAEVGLGNAMGTVQETEKVADENAPLVAVDAGHQGPGQDMSGQEPNAPGSDVMKARLATGTTGTTTGVNEYELTLQVALKLKEELLERGYRVVMTRETHDIDISNIDRCQIAEEAGADIMVRIHANGSEDSSVSGALTIAPTETNPDTQDIYEDSMRLSRLVIDSYCAATGLGNRDIWITDEMTGINWSNIPVTYLEMGFMTNPGDDQYMCEESNQSVMAGGIADGIDAYFGR